MGEVATRREVLVPDIGDFTDVPVVEILVEVGQRVEKEDSLVVVESEKATMEVPSPASGVVAEICVAVGDDVSEGSLLLVLDADEPADSAHEPPAQAEPTTVAEAPHQEPADPAGPVYASPSVRRLARERGVDLSAISGTGRKGRITKEDLEDPETGPAGTGATAQDRIPLTRIQQLSRDAVSRAWVRVPHVTHHEDADITELEAFRKRLNDEQADVKVTMVALILKACAAVLDAHPRFASSLEGDELILKRERHLGFAADTPDGLVVPVIRDVGQKGILEIAGELGELSVTARAGRLSPRQISGAVFTISSLGGIGGTSFTPIVNLPQVAILGVSRNEIRPVWDGQEFQPRLILPLSLSYDHRVIDGAAAARFCVDLAASLRDLRRVLL